MQLNNIIAIEGTLELVTGLHIGAGNEELHIGGIDNPVLKHPYTNQPYIPGSSLKGKMRSMLEWKAGIVSECEGKPVSAKVLAKLKDSTKKQNATRIAQLFGVAGDANDEKIALELGPTRLSFWDCHLTQAWLDERLNQQQSYTEAKSENIIDRIKGVAEHPRQSERVPAGATFSFKLTIRQLEGDENLLNTVFAGLKLLELDGIGGSGSRGYGKIKFTLNDAAHQAQFEQTQAFA
ncbi:MAG: type III-A CRISPR-associated RAMP protein Csm3 [Pseudomonadales bacterium]|nr:type III-A CRISPR-associated RAMP protein Csm3 [Pseudomonadales bacterium]